MAKRIVSNLSDNLGACRHCGARIAWVTSKNGKKYPVNTAPRPLGRVEYDTADFHSDTCPVAQHAAQEMEKAAKSITPADVQLALAVPQIISSIMALITTPSIRDFIWQHDPAVLNAVERALVAGGVIQLASPLPEDQAEEPPMPVEDPGDKPPVEGLAPTPFDEAKAREEIERATRTGRYKEPQ